MSEKAILPTSWAAYAETKSLKNIGAIWEDYTAWMTRMGHDLSQESWKRWCDRRAQTNANASAKAESGTIRHPEYREPPEWKRDAATPIEAAIACKNILATLDKIGGAPTHIEPPVAIPNELCSCGRLRALDSATCTACKSLGAPASTEALSSPEIDGGEPSSGDLFDGETESEDERFEERNDQSETRDEAFGGI